MFKHLLQYFRSVKDTDPKPAYSLWAKYYDDQPDNLMLALDEAILTDLIAGVDLYNKRVADIGCGTGRHWQRLRNKNPEKILGFDVSEEMLAILKQKFPEAKTSRMVNHRLEGLENESCHLVISTLTLAHIKDIAAAMKEWKRALKPGGDIIITDYHPEALAKGGKRTFKHNDQTVSIKNYIHPLEKIIALARQLGLQVIRLEEKTADETVRHYYEKQNSINVFEAWKDVPIIYGIHLKKMDDTV